MDWAFLMRVGLGRLGLAPEVFWAMTPKEFRAAAGLDAGRSALDRGGLAELSARFPDEPISNCE